jgi:hypothetical protein
MESIEQDRMLNNLAKILDKTLEAMYDRRMGFCLIVRPFGQRPAVADYISNVDREVMLEALQESITRLKNKEDIPPTIGRA